MTLPAAVLVEPREPGNVGAVARVMANFGLSELLIVGAPELPAPRDFVTATAAGRPILGAAARAESLEAALASFHAAVAVTRRAGKHRPPDLGPLDLPPFLDGLPSGARAALVFGREADGLRAEEALLCGRLLAIPAVPEAPSLNLAQAVAVVAFAWFAGGGAVPGRAGAGFPGPAGVEVPGDASVSRPAEPLATRAVQEDLFRALESALARIGFLEGDRAADSMASIRRILGRALLTDREARLLRGLARKLGEPGPG